MGFEKLSSKRDFNTMKASKSNLTNKNEAGSSSADSLDKYDKATKPEESKISSQNISDSQSR